MAASPPPLSRVIVAAGDLFDQHREIDCISHGFLCCSPCFLNMDWNLTIDRFTLSSGHTCASGESQRYSTLFYMYPWSMQYSNIASTFWLTPCESIAWDDHYWCQPRQTRQKSSVQCNCGFFFIVTRLTWCDFKFVTNTWTHTRQAMTIS